MDKLLELIDSKRNIKKSSLNIYRVNLGKAYRAITQKPMDEFSLDFLKDMDSVLDFLKDFKSPTKRTYLSSFIVAMDSSDMDHKLVDDYRDEMLKTQKSVDKSYEDGKMSEKQKSNWVSFKVLKNITKSLQRELKEDGAFDRETLTKKQRQDMQDWVIASLYTADTENNPPIRLDYANMRVIKKENYEKLPEQERDDYNWLVLNKRDMVFVFNDFKTESRYGSKTIKVGKVLKSVLIKWLPHVEDEGYLLLSNTKHESPMTSANLGVNISRIFRRTGKNITLNLIRNIFLSERFPRKEEDEKKEVTEKMMTSTGVADAVYRKKTDKE